MYVGGWGEGNDPRADVSVLSSLILALGYSSLSVSLSFSLCLSHSLSFSERKVGCLRFVLQHRSTLIFRVNDASGLKWPLLLSVSQRRERVKSIECVSKS